MSIHGDTTTTFAGSLAAYYQQIPVGHVEAGLRTGNIYSPFPEEMNRKLTGSIAALHFAPTETAKHNLLRENVSADHIFVTGNTVIDALMNTVCDAYEMDEALQKVDFTNHRVILLTTHRRENLGEPMMAAIEGYITLARTAQNIEVARIRVVKPLTAEEETKLIAGLEQLTGKKIDPLYTVDPSILGGVVIQIGDRLIDGSLMRQLSDMKHTLLQADVTNEVTDE